jgi:hypothetical protein
VVVVDDAGGMVVVDSRPVAVVGAELPAPSPDGFGVDDPPPVGDDVGPVTVGGTVVAGAGAGTVDGDGDGATEAHRLA